jgi:beta-lactamase superfamily II metal-dependent hydrolase
VKQGDCSIIQHPSGHVTVVDVCNARQDFSEATKSSLLKAFVGKSVPGSFGQKDYPVNPLQYMQQRNITSVFRFILTHPDMDHMDGLADLFAVHSPPNFWDIRNNRDVEFGGNSPYRQEDWDFYKTLRDGKATTTKRLVLHAGDAGKYWNRNEDRSAGGDGIYLLAPTPELAANAADNDNYNDGSYVLLYQSNAGRILLAGDSHDETWEHILANHAEEVADVELLIAPHHGRKSGRSYEFLDVVRPKLTFFGNADSEHLAYGAWSNRGLAKITNNQGDCLIADTNGEAMQVFATNHRYAVAVNSATYYSSAHQAYYLCSLPPPVRRAA